MQIPTHYIRSRYLCGQPRDFFPLPLKEAVWARVLWYSYNGKAGATKLVSGSLPIVQQITECKSDGRKTWDLDPALGLTSSPWINHLTSLVLMFFILKIDRKI